jgi:hypothetical protein
VLASLSRLPSLACVPVAFFIQKIISDSKFKVIACKMHALVSGGRLLETTLGSRAVLSVSGSETFKFLQVRTGDSTYCVLL